MNNNKSKQNSKIRSVLGLSLLYLAILLNWQWVWGIIFLIWVIPDIFSGITYFMEPIERKTHPILYWLIITSWIWMSVYMIALPFFPHLNGQITEPIQHSKEIGQYDDKPIIKTKKTLLSINPNDNKSNSSKGQVNQMQIKDVTTKSTIDTIAYKIYDQKETNCYVGISADLNIYDTDLEKHSNELWGYFYNNDISPFISDIIDERIYFIYSRTDDEGNYKATIAYRTKNINNLFEGLNGVQIPPSKYAVFEYNGNGIEKFISQTWKKVNASDLETNNEFNMEVYTLDEEYEVTNAEIRIKIK